MGPDSDLTEHALNSSHDFYELLGVGAAANDTEIRRAYRQTALKYHPDKVGADTEKLEKFHLLQIAYDVLSDSSARQVYDSARRARQEKKEREQAYEGRRRHLKEELERRESAGVAGLKRKREEDLEEEAFQRELKRLAADGARRRKEREEQLRREAEQIEREQNQSLSAEAAAPNHITNEGPDDMDRTVKLRYPVDHPLAKNLDRETITTRFSRFGKIDHIMLKPKKIKSDGAKHRREYNVVFIVYSSIVGAHAAITDLPVLAAKGAGDSEEQVPWNFFEEVNWASGKEPECIPRQKPTPRPSTPSASTAVESPLRDCPSTPSTPNPTKSHDGLRKVPSFGSFKGTPKSVASPSADELMLIRLKNAERKRLAEKLRQEEAQEDNKT